MIATLGLVLFLAEKPAVSCATLGNEVWNRLTTAAASMEPENAREAVYEEATQDATTCPDHEKIAYVRLRTLELGVGDIRLMGTRIELGRSLSRAFPRSAAIATVRARLEGSTSLARQAASLDPSYAPAQVTLATRLLADRDPAGARRALDAVRDLAVVDDGYTVLARLRWSQGDVDGAIQAARRELGERPLGVEPGGGPPEQAAIDQAHEILGLAYLRKGALDKAAPHLLLAKQAGLEDARKAVAGADRALRRALLRARRAPGRD
jgi:hypothetical protein